MSLSAVLLVNLYQTTIAAVNKKTTFVAPISPTSVNHLPTTSVAKKVFLTAMEIANQTKSLAVTMNSSTASIRITNASPIAAAIPTNTVVKKDSSATT